MEIAEKNYAKRCRPKDWLKIMKIGQWLWLSWSPEVRGSKPVIGKLVYRATILKNKNKEN